MKIKDAELLTGLSANTIRFYENEGLISVKRNSNSYRVYDENNIEELKYIKNLRKLGLSISTIKELNNKKISLKKVLEDRIREIEEEEITFESKKDIIREILQDINKNVDINLNKYSEELEYIETEEYTELITEINKFSQRSLSFQLLITLIWSSPFITFYTSISEENYESIGLKSMLCIIATVILTLSWRKYLSQNDKKFGGTISFIVGIMLVLILTLVIYVFIGKLQALIFVPDDYIMYMYKAPYSYISLFFEVEIFILLITFLYTRIKNVEWQWATCVFDFMKNNFIKFIVLNLVLLYMGITGITVVTKTQIIDYSFYNPFGTEYTYNDINKVSAGFIGKQRKLFGGQPGDFYYIVTLNDNKKINFYQANSAYEDTYLELEVFDKLIVDNTKSKKVSSKENYKLCYFDKRYVDRFLRIIEY